jgi:transcription antitermination factor NusG
LDWLIVLAGRMKILERLRSEGFETYHPMCRQRVRRNGGTMYFERPVLGMYVFLRMVLLGPDDDWPHLFHRINCRVLMSEEKPCIVRHHEIQQLKDKEIRGYIPNSFKARFKPLQRVIISRGPLVNHEAVFKRERGALDVIEISLFGSTREIVMPMGSIVAA